MLNPPGMMKNLLFKSTLFLSLSINVAAVFYFVNKLYISYKQPKGTANATLRSNTKYWSNRDELFEKLSIDTNDIVFVGNSLTQYFELAELFKNNHVKNRGIIGDCTKGVIDRLNPIVNGSPNRIFLEIGINDVASKTPVDSILKQYETIVQTIKERSPKTTIYIESILPIADTSSNIYTSWCSPEGNQIIKTINTRLQELAKKMDVVYLDFYNSFAENDHLKPNLTYDGVHLTGDGYLLWTKLLEPYVNSEKMHNLLGKL